MLKHAFVFVALQVVFKEIKISYALQLRDISNIIENFQRNEVRYNNERDYRSQLDENKSYGLISSRELDELINQVANDVYHQDNHKFKDRTKNLKVSRYYKFGSLKNRNSQPFMKINSQIGQRKPIKAVLSNVEVNSIDLGLDRGQINDNDSKLYLVLNPQANLNENDFKDITGLLKLLSDSAGKKIYAKHDDTRIQKDPRYKGFVIADGRQARRRNRESKELYSLQNSLEEFKPKRARSDYGGAGGRTPIPYIGHRDIYERE